LDEAAHERCHAKSGPAPLHGSLTRLRLRRRRLRRLDLPPHLLHLLELRSTRL